jgi:hypothetical protein
MVRILLPPAATHTNPIIPSAGPVRPVYNGRMRSVALIDAELSLPVIRADIEERRHHFFRLGEGWTQPCSYRAIAAVAAVLRSARLGRLSNNGRTASRRRRGGLLAADASGRGRHMVIAWRGDAAKTGWLSLVRKC